MQKQKSTTEYNLLLCTRYTAVHMRLRNCVVYITFPIQYDTPYASKQHKLTRSIFYVVTYYRNFYYTLTYICVECTRGAEYASFVLTYILHGSKLLLKINYNVPSVGFPPE